MLTDRDETSKLYRGPSIDASYQVSVHLAKGFQMRRLKCEKLTDDGRQVMAKAHIANHVKKFKKRKRRNWRKNCKKFTISSEVVQRNQKEVSLFFTLRKII
jgi:hypothetical protein